MIRSTWSAKQDGGGWKTLKKEENPVCFDPLGDRYQFSVDGQRSWLKGLFRGQDKKSRSAVVRNYGPVSPFVSSFENKSMCCVD